MDNILANLNDLASFSIPVEGNLIIGILALFAALLAIAMLFAKQALTAAISLLGVLLCTAGIYAMMGEHFIAAIQLVVYAGAIMVLFIFSIMLLNFKREEQRDVKILSLPFLFGFTATATSFSLVVYAIYSSISNDTTNMQNGPYTEENIMSMGGNTLAIARELYTTHALLFEVTSLALLIALIGAVVLAKRKFD